MQRKPTIIQFNKQEGTCGRMLHDHGITSQTDFIRLDTFGPSIEKTTNNKQAFSFNKATRFTSKSIFESNSNLTQNAPIRIKPSELKHVCPKASLIIDINHPLHPNFSEGKEIRFHVRSGSVHKMMSKTQLRLSPSKLINHKKIINQTLLNEHSVKSDSDDDHTYDLKNLTNGEISLQDKRNSMFPEANKTYLVSPKRTFNHNESRTGFGMHARNSGPFRTPMARRNDSISDLVSQLSQNFYPRNGNVPFMHTGPRFTKFGVQSKFCDK
jgi:hypothetical protein